LFIRLGARKLELPHFRVPRESRLNIHQNARLTPTGRERIVRAVLQGGQTPQAAAQAAGVCPRTARKWVARFQAAGRAGLRDRSSRPKRLRQPPRPAVIAQVMALRRERLSGRHIAQTVGVSPATVSRILKRAGLSRLKDLARLSRCGATNASIRAN
jgi:transposase